jgi:hypothetical protein
MRGQKRTYRVDFSSTGNDYHLCTRSNLLFFIPRHCDWGGVSVEAEVGVEHGDPCLMLDLEVGECLRLRSRDRANSRLEVCIEHIEVRARGRRARVELSCAAPIRPYRW